MNFARALSVMAALAIVAVLLTMLALGLALRSADADVVVNAHAVVNAAARRIGAAYTAQISTLRTDLALPLSTSSLNGFGRRVVVATIGDNEGIDGGLYLNKYGIVSDGPQPVASSVERRAIATLAHTILRGRAQNSANVILPNGDLVAIDAVALGDRSGIAWARERISASALRGQRSTFPLIALAALSCGLLVAFCAWIVWTMRRDARLVIAAIAALEADPLAQTAMPAGDFGSIARAVSLMAQRRAAAEAVAQRSERLAAVGRLAANAAHEIRNPLNALRLQLDVLRRRLSPALDEPATKLQREIARLDTVVTGMLAIASDPGVPTSTVDLKGVAAHAIDVLELDAVSRGRTFSFACEPAANTTVQGNADRLVQLAINILANAVDAAPPNSEIGVVLSTGPMLTVTDRGRGITDSDLPKLFEPFFTTKPSGTGLGLAIAQEIARAHGARIDVTSEPGKTAICVDFRNAPK